jgi:hypothetical protein
MTHVRMLSNIDAPHLDLFPSIRLELDVPSTTEIQNASGARQPRLNFLMKRDALSRFIRKEPGRKASAPCYLWLPRGVCGCSVTRARRRVSSKLLTLATILDRDTVGSTAVLQ